MGKHEEQELEKYDGYLDLVVHGHEDREIVVIICGLIETVKPAAYGD